MRVRRHWIRRTIWDCNVIISYAIFTNTNIRRPRFADNYQHCVLVRTLNICSSRPFERIVIFETKNTIVLRVKNVRASGPNVVLQSTHFRTRETLRIFRDFPVVLPEQNSREKSRTFSNKEYTISTAIINTLGIYISVTYKCCPRNTVLVFFDPSLNVCPVLNL